MALVRPHRCLSWKCRPGLTEATQAKAQDYDDDRAKWQREAEAERDRSRCEIEAILTREAQQRKQRDVAGGREGYVQ